VVAPLYAATTEVGRQFDDIRAKNGLKAALKWRRAQFQDEEELAAASEAPASPNLDVPAENIIEYPERMAAAETPLRVDWFDLEMAFQFVSGNEHREHQAFLCKRTGKLFYHSDLLGDDEEELPVDVEDTDKYISIPHKKELDLGKPLVLDFVGQFLPDDCEHVRDMFRRRGAYARFKDLLVHRRALDQWHKYEAKREKEALREWCAASSIEISE
jgi:hypothetical protein